MGNTKKLREMKMSDEVIAAINEELAYHSTLEGSGRGDAKDHGLSGQIVCLRTYLRKVEDAWNHVGGDEAALHEMRKVASIAIRALEEYGCPRRSRDD
jgi:hypothetical protein